MFYAQTWKLYAEHDGTCIFYSDKEDIELPILNMKLFTVRRVVTTFCNLGFLSAVIFCSKEANENQRMLTMFLSSFFLFAFPRLSVIKSTKKWNNWVRISFNIILACIVSIIVVLLFEQCMKAFAIF